MLIELIGCTGAGKSTLVREALNEGHSQEINIITSYDFVLSWLHLGWLENHALRMLFLNVAAIMASTITMRKNIPFYRFAIKTILSLPPEVRLAEKLKIARLTFRNIGIDEIVRHAKSDEQVVLVDEGTLHIAHYLFVHVFAEPDPAAIYSFIRLVSLPDLVIYVSATEAVLIERIIARGHKRVKANSHESIARFIQHGIAVFEKMKEFSVLRDRLLLVENGTWKNVPETHKNIPGSNLARNLIAAAADIRKGAYFYREQS